MKPSRRLDRIPPYLFAELERKVSAKRAAGIDVISLGIGDPDRPTPALVVDVGEDLHIDLSGPAVPVYRGVLADDFRHELENL